MIVHMSSQIVSRLMGKDDGCYGVVERMYRIEVISQRTNFIIRTSEVVQYGSIK